MIRNLTDVKQSKQHFDCVSIAQEAAAIVSHSISHSGLLETIRPSGNMPQTNGVL
jgi:hypothetical protein